MSLLILLLAILILFTGRQASASYNGANIIDNSVFLNSNTMSKAQIQSFLSSKGSGLSSRSYVLNCYGQDSKEREWYTAVGAPCDQSVPASDIIYYASKIYGINPQVVLSTLQKEQSLITSPNPTRWQIEHAMGYGCPTSGTCSDSTFFYQIDSGVWVLRYHYERANGNLDWWSPSSSWVCGTEKSFYSPSLYPGVNTKFYDGNGVHYRTHNIANAATSSLYCYTPHAYNNPQGLYGRAPYGTVGQYYSGSYNFVTFFEAWFGSTLSNGYEVVSFSKPSGIIGSNTTPMTIRVRNLSGITWYADGSVPSGQHPTRLTSISYENTPFANQSDPAWLGTRNQVRMVETEVANNEIATFTATFSGAGVAGGQSYFHKYTITVDGVKVYPFQDLTHTMSKVSSDYDFSIVSINTPPLSLKPGDSWNVKIRVRNDGLKNWYSDNHSSYSGSKIRLMNKGYQNSPYAYPGDPAWLGTKNQIVLKEPSVAPGQIGTFTFKVAGPFSSQDFTHRFNLVLDGVASISPTKVITYRQTTPQPIYNYVSMGATNPPATMATGQAATATVRIKNTGNVVWRNEAYKIGSSGSMRLVMSKPYYRASVFSDQGQSWISSSTQIRMVEPTVVPGQTATFQFTWTAPATAKKYVEPFTFVIDGVKTYPNKGMQFTVDVN